MCLERTSGERYVFGLVFSQGGSEPGARYLPVPRGSSIHDEIIDDVNLNVNHCTIALTSIGYEMS